MATVSIPTPLRPHTDGLGTVQAEGTNVAEVLQHVGGRYPEFHKRIFAADGAMHQHVNVFVNDEDIRFMDDLETLVGPKDQVSIIPAIAGG